MAKGTVPKIVRKANRLGKRFVKTQYARQRSANLRNLDTVAGSAAVIIIKAGGKDLCFAGKPSECVTVNDPVAVTLKGVAVGMRRLWEFASVRIRFIYGIVHHCLSNINSNQINIQH
jgi:hypothetical protein